MVEIDNKEKVDYLFKFIIIGDTGVGKSCILNQYLRGKCKKFIGLSKFNIACFFYSQSKHKAYSRGGIWHEVWEGQSEDNQGANMGHCWLRTIQIGDT